MLFFWTFYSTKNPEENESQCFQHNIIIINVSWSAYHYIRLIYEGSCDTEDWSNDAENATLITGRNSFLKYIQIKNSYWKCCCFYFIFKQRKHPRRASYTYINIRYKMSNQISVKLHSGRGCPAWQCSTEYSYHFSQINIKMINY